MITYAEIEYYISFYFNSMYLYESRIETGWRRSSFLRQKHTAIVATDTILQSINIICQTRLRILNPQDTVQLKKKKILLAKPNQTTATAYSLTTHPKQFVVHTHQHNMTIMIRPQLQKAGQIFTLY